jgi:predicted aminopeptidase
MQQYALLGLLVAIAASSSGCYLGHLAVGQTRLLKARQPIDAVLADPATPPETRDRLRLVVEAREFADLLGLEVGGQYTSFVPWPGDRVVTSVVATRPGEVTPAGFHFPILGELPYKGFFDRERADREAEELRAEGLDVCLFGARAYSTLGWLDDPVTGPMLRSEEGQLVETIVHELVHATVYVRDHVDFNESVASFIGQEGSVLFYEQRGQAAAARRRRFEIQDARIIDSERLLLRDQVAELYQTREAGAAREREREQLEARAREQISRLAMETTDAAQLAGSLRLNDACLALTGTYSADIEGYSELLEGLDGELPAFITRLQLVADAKEPAAALLQD